MSAKPLTVYSRLGCHLCEDMQNLLPNYLEEAGMRPYEKILVVNATNGERLETYAIPGPAGSPVFRLNGAAARKGNPGDIVTIMSFGRCSEEEAEGFKPKIIVLDENNKIVERKGALNYA